MFWVSEYLRYVNVANFKQMLHNVYHYPRLHILQLKHQGLNNIKITA